MLLAATHCKSQTLERLWCKSWVLRKLPILLKPNCPCFGNQILKMPPIPQGTFQEAQTVKNLPAMQETHWVRDAQKCVQDLGRVGLESWKEGGSVR